MRKGEGIHSADEMSGEKLKVGREQHVKEGEWENRAGVSRSTW